MNKAIVIGNISVTEQDHVGQLAKGWGLSIVLHGCLMLAVMTAMPKLTLTQENQPFHWTVALVEAPAPAPAVSTPIPPAPAKPAQAKPQPPRPEPSPQLATRQVQRQDVPQPIHRESEPVPQEVRVAQRETEPVLRELEPVQRDVQTLQPEFQPKVAAERPAQRAEPAREVVAMENTRPDAQESKRAEPVVEPPAPQIHQQMAETEPETEVVARAPAMEAPVPPPVIEQSAPVEHATTTAPAPPAPASPSPAVPETIEPPSVPPVAATATHEAPAPAVQEQAPVVARSLTPSPARKADYGWLAESLHRRIVELRHYPSAARLNGWEGKVVLRVQIRQDGNLDSVSVVKSSGHETLDNAAMEAVRRACPLHLKHELASPMVVVQVPINYSLNR